MDQWKNRSRQELLEELDAMQKRTAQIESRLSRMEKTAEAHKYAELIIAASPTILFRRLAAEELKDRKMVYVSPNIARFGYAAEDFMEDRIMFRDIVHPDDTERTKKEINEYVSRNRDEYTQIYRIVTRDGQARWIEDRTSVVEDPETGVRFHQGIVTDIHRRKEAEEKLRESEEKFRRIVETTREGFLLMDRDMTILDLNHAFCRMTGYSRPELMGRRFIDMVAEKQRPYLSANREDLLGCKSWELESELAARTGAGVPVLIHGDALLGDDGSIIGNMAFVTDMSEQKKALTLAGEVQKSLLPEKAPRIEGLDIAGGSVSCDEVGGDYYDFFVRPDDPGNKVFVAVGDISGHGVDAALLMTTARAFLRMRASQPGDIADIITAMNRHLAKDVEESARFMTLFFLAVDVEKKTIQWIRAGHEPAWLYDPAENVFEELKGPGMALGVDEDFAYRSSRGKNLEKGQVILVGTDGVWEGRNRAGEMFGKRRLQEAIRKNASFSAETIVEAIFQEHGRFTRDARPEDDVTLAVVKITR